MLHQFITDSGYIVGVVGEVGSEEELTFLELIQAPGQVRLGTRLKAAVVGGQDPADLKVEGLGTVFLFRSVVWSVDHDLEEEKENSLVMYAGSLYRRQRQPVTWYEKGLLCYFPICCLNVSCLGYTS